MRGVAVVLAALLVVVPARARAEDPLHRALRWEQISVSEYTIWGFRLRLDLSTARSTADGYTPQGAARLSATRELGPLQLYTAVQAQPEVDAEAMVISGFRAGPASLECGIMDLEGDQGPPAPIVAFKLSASL